MIFVAPEVTTQMPALNVWLNSRLNGFASVEGSVITPAAPEPGVPEQDAAATLNSLTVALATPVPTTMRRKIPGVPFTVVVAAAVMLVPDEPPSASRPEVSVANARRFAPSEPPTIAVTGGATPPFGPANSAGKSLAWPARSATVMVPLVNALARTRACEAPDAQTIPYGPLAAIVVTYCDVLRILKKVATHVVPPSNEISGVTVAVHVPVSVTPAPPCAASATCAAPFSAVM